MHLLLLAACGSSPVTDSGSPTTGQTAGILTALTYNVHGLPDPLSSTERPGAERMERIAPLLEAHDLVGLQEDFDAANHALLSATEHPISQWFEDPVDEDRAYGAGLALLSRVGVESNYFEEHYDDCAGILDGASDCLASKGFQVLRLTLGGAEVDVYNTHHEAGGGDEDDAARTAQVSQVLASMDGRSAGRAIVFMGDTNLHWSDPEDVVELERYQAAGLRCACDEVGCGDDHIDRIFLRDSDELALSTLGWWVDETFVDEDGVGLSDHPAVAAELSWELR